MLEWNSLAVKLLIIVAECIAIAILLKILVTAVERINRQAVIANSKRLRNLDILNSNYKKLFIVIQNEWSFDIRCNSKAQFDNFNCDKYFANVLLEDLPKYKKVIETAQTNKKIKDQYSKEVALTASEITEEECKRIRISYEKFLKIENELFIKGLLQPDISPRFIFNVSYCSPMGRNLYQKNLQYGLKDLVSFYDEAVAREEYQQSKTYQRGLMTPGLRMKILTRDNYRCQICGRTAKDGATLEVDHIIPISKGGQTVEENLQTLCWDCNRGKSDKY